MEVKRACPFRFTLAPCLRCFGVETNPDTCKYRSEYLCPRIEEEGKALGYEWPLQQAYLPG